MQTKLIRSIYRISQVAQGGVITIGNFDGVHLGHQQLIKKVIAKAQELNAPSVVITFEPHAFEFFSKGNVTIPRLTRLREKFLALQQLGVDYVLILPFNQQLANLSASDFVTEILVSQLHVRHLILGEDFRFGQQRLGDIALLMNMGQDYGFTVETMPAFEVLGERVSSTRVRKTLALGDHHLVKALLGRPYTMCGRVRHGDKRGREFGFPTANIFLHRKLTPVKGVYTIYMHGIGEKPLPGVANVGIRPSVDGTRTLLEVHLLDFNQDIYGRYVTVEFCEKLRDEERYANLDLLKAQIAKDVALARDYFNKHGKL